MRLTENDGMPREIPEKLFALMKQASAKGLRMGQLFGNLFDEIGDPFYMENNELVDALELYLTKTFSGDER